MNELDEVNLEIVITAYKIDRGSWQPVNLFTTLSELETVRKKYKKLWGARKLLFIYEEF